MYTAQIKQRQFWHLMACIPSRIRITQYQGYMLLTVLSGSLPVEDLNRWRTGIHKTEIKILL